jgi:hypothetical protein
MRSATRGWRLSGIGALLVAVGAEAATMTRGPYLQQMTTSSVIIVWRTDATTDGVVRYGASPSALTQTVTDPSKTQHEVKLTGLSSSTRYYYSVGSSSQTFSTGADYWFVTSPPVGADVPTRIWVLGDPGTANSSQEAVRDALKNKIANGTERDIDLWLMLGDNAYDDGTDEEYQAAVFEMYPTFLRNRTLWPTLGNHDAHTGSGLGHPYYSIFTLPKSGEAGGRSSGTESYYSFDYANIHFICLNSEDESRAPTGAMLTWAQQDAADTDQDWIIAYWHHPPFTNGSHQDTETKLAQMRTNALPILEAAGVDLVLTGHSHGYERSFLIHGAYSITYQSSAAAAAPYKVNSGNGQESGDGAYQKLTPAQPNQAGVYIVAGSSGKTGGVSSHPLKYKSLSRLGSLVLDITGNRLDAFFLNSSGVKEDFFTMIKGADSLRGDVNNDNAVTLADLRRLLAILTGGSSTVEERGRADLTGDTKVSLADARELVGILVSP